MVYVPSMRNWPDQRTAASIYIDGREGRAKSSPAPIIIGRMPVLLSNLRNGFIIALVNCYYTTPPATATDAMLQLLLVVVVVGSGECPTCTRFHYDSALN